MGRKKWENGTLLSPETFAQKVDRRVLGGTYRGPSIRKKKKN